MLKRIFATFFLSGTLCAQAATTPAAAPSVDTGAWDKHLIETLDAIRSTKGNVDAGQSPISALRLYTPSIEQLALLNDKANVDALIVMADADLPKPPPPAFPGDVPEELFTQIIWARSECAALEAVGERDKAKEITNRYQDSLKDFGGEDANRFLDLILLRAQVGDWAETNRLLDLTATQRTNLAPRFALIAALQNNKEQFQTYIKIDQENPAIARDPMGAVMSSREIAYLYATTGDMASAEKQVMTIPEG